MRRLLEALGALLVLAVVGPAIAAAQDATPPAGPAATDVARTDVRYFLPFTPDGLNPGLTVAARTDGVCGFESAAVLGRPDAWDCIGADNQVYDPCFENPFTLPDAPAEVACIDSPFSTDVVLLTLTQPLERQKEPTADTGADPAMGGAEDATIDAWDLPWALELANGDRCTLLHGTLTVAAGQVVHYGCVNRGTVLGETDRSGPVWTVSYVAEGAFASSLVAVSAAWS